MNRLLPLGTALVVSACYEPELDECVRACDGRDDCMAGQVCGSDGWCASPDNAGRCAAMLDHTRLRLLVEGVGTLAVSPLDVACAGAPRGEGDCTVSAAVGTEVTIVPLASRTRWRFDAWTTDACADAESTCTVVVQPPETLVGARFVAISD